MSSYKVIADVFDDVADALARAADALRDLEPDPDGEDRRRALARERTRRYRARLAAAAQVIYPSARDARDVARDVASRSEFDEFSELAGPTSRRPTVREDGRRDAVGPMRDVTSDATSRDAWRDAAATAEDKARAQRKVRELSEQLRNARQEGGPR